MTIFDSTKFRMLLAGQDQKQKDVCKKLGVAVSTLIDWKKGRSEPSLKHLSKIALMLKVQPKDLLKTT